MEELEGNGMVYSAGIRDIQQQECIPATRCIWVRGFGRKGQAVTYLDCFQSEVQMRVWRRVRMGNC